MGSAQVTLGARYSGLGARTSRRTGRARRLATAAVVTSVFWASAVHAQEKLPRTPDGKPDLQGIWDFRTITPLERPNQFAEKETLTAEEAAALEQRTAETRVDRAPAAGNPGTYNQFWFDFGNRVVDDKRTSLIVDPADGRLPPLTPEAEKRAAVRAERLKRPAEGPEDRPTWERCLLGFNSGPPIMPSGYNNNIQIVQTRDHVVILNEMVHDARVVPLSNRPHSGGRRWLGESRGRWEGDTLVVETRNFTANGTGTIGLRTPPSEQLRLTERFTLRNARTLLYQFTVEDPATWTRPWTAVVPMQKTDEQIYEYACHEGNLGMVGIMAGAREQETGR
jgi:hypothetical protein